jgi:excisionase family DNA binding protein
LRALTIEQACARYGVSRTTLYRYAKDGRLTLNKIGPRLVRLDADELDGVFHGELIHTA